MASSQNQRLRRAAGKAARRKVVVAEKRRADSLEAAQSESRQIKEAAQSPVRSTLISERLWDDGMGWAVMARTMPSGLIAASFFLIDAWCLGIKDAFFSVMKLDEFLDHIAATSEDQPMIQIDPSALRKLLHDAAAFATSLGIAPANAFTKVEAIFGDTPLSTDTFTFGKDGKPLFVPGPNDGPAKIAQLTDTIGKHTGTDGFTVMRTPGQDTMPLIE